MTAVYDVSVKKVAEEAKVRFGQDMTKSQSKEFERKLQNYGQKKISSAAADFKIEAGTAEHKRDEAFVSEGGPARQIVCTIHDNIPANIFEPQILMTIGGIQKRLKRLLSDDFTVEMD